MNPVALLFRSRKFLLALADALVSIITLVLTQYLSPSSLDMALKIIALLQPVIIAVIVSISVEDAALKSAGAPVVPPELPPVQ